MYIAENMFTSKPDDERLPKETRCYNLLSELGIGFTGIDHDRADTIELCRKIEEKLGCRICKNLFLSNRQQTDFYLLLMPGDKPFKTKQLSRQINTSRLSFGSFEDMERLLDITPGSVSVLGLMNDSRREVRLLIDRELLNDEYIGCHPCINTSTLKIRTADVINIFLPKLGVTPTIVDLPSQLSD